MSLYYQIDVLEHNQLPLTFETTSLTHSVSTKDSWLGNDIETDKNLRAELHSIKTHRRFEVEIAETDTTVIHKFFQAINRTSEELKFDIHLMKQLPGNNTSELMSVSVEDVQVMQYHVTRNGYVFAFHVTAQNTPPDDWES